MSRVLIVEDEEKLRALLAMTLEEEGWETAQAGTAEQALQWLARSEVPDLLITDVRMPGMSGLDLLRRVRQEHRDLECIVMTAHDDTRTGVEAMRAGAFEYVLKPFEMDEMVLLAASALERRKLRGEVQDLKIRELGRYRLDNVLGGSKGIQEALRQAKLVARRDTTVLLRGSSGTGKEWLARGIHGESGRENFIAVNCTAVPENLLEGELFGHERGAFPAGNQPNPGVFEQAANGTVFLDEVGELPLQLQIKLLRVLQEREGVRVGGTQPVPMRARVIAATHRNLEEEVRSGEFREDLYFRLSVFPIFIPSLHERLEDFPAWVEHFLTRFGHRQGLEDGVLSRLMEYSWPGNLRELENCLERAAIVAAGRPVRLADFPEPVRQRQPLASPSVFKLPPTGVSLDEVEKNLILQALEMTKGNKTRAAQLLGITRRALYSKMHTHRIRGTAGGDGSETRESSPDAMLKG